MWITLKIGMFYGAPILAVVLATVWFVMLLLRVRRGQLMRPQAAASVARKERSELRGI